MISTDEEVDLDVIDIDANVVCDIMVKPCSAPASWQLLIHCPQGCRLSGFACQLHHDRFEEQLEHARTCPRCQMNCTICGAPCKSVTWRKI